MNFHAESVGGTPQTESRVAPFRPVVRATPVLVTDTATTVACASHRASNSLYFAASPRRHSSLPHLSFRSPTARLELPRPTQSRPFVNLVAVAVRRLVTSCETHLLLIAGTRRYG